jgi:hypothetical protein
MSENRVFFPQEALDDWLDEGRVQLVGDELTTTPEGRRLRVESALRFVAEVGGGADPLGLVGKVKTLEQVQALSGEHCADSVIIGDCAYQVVEGFVGELLSSVRRTARRKVEEGGDRPSDRLGEVLADLGKAGG